MGYTVFYEEAKQEKSRIGWKDILSESFKKHSMKDLEYAMAAGSAYDTASPETMLKKWHKPWVWTRVFLLLSLVGLGFYLLLQLFGANPNVGWPMLIILTCITPITTMVLFWELNVARDISFLKLLGCFFIGGFLAIAFTLVLYDAGIDQTALNLTHTDSTGVWALWVAPLTEEPAKLLAGFVILTLLVKKETCIFGTTGLAVGAGVGTGFTLFESFGYVMTNATNAVTENDASWQSVFEAGLQVVKARSIPGLNLHMLMCVPYIAMMALVYHETKDWKKSILNRRTGLAFLISCILHGWWDCMQGVALEFLVITGTPMNTEAEIDAARKIFYNVIEIQTWVIALLFLVCNLYTIRLCLRQAVREGSYVSGQGRQLGQLTQPYFDAGDNNRNDNRDVNWDNNRKDIDSVTAPQNTRSLQVLSIGKALPGEFWQCRDTVLIGKMSNCEIKFPGDTPGLSRVHCRLTNCGSYWTICDMGSTYGTNVNGKSLQAQKEYRLPTESVVELGSANVRLKIE